MYWGIRNYADKIGLGIDVIMYYGYRVRRARSRRIVRWTGDKLATGMGTAVAKTTRRELSMTLELPTQSKNCLEKVDIVGHQIKSHSGFTSWTYISDTHLKNFGIPNLK